MQVWYSYSKRSWRFIKAHKFKREKGLWNSKQTRTHGSRVGLEFSTGETLWTNQVWGLVEPCSSSAECKEQFCFHPERDKVWMALLNKHKTLKVNAIFPVYHIPIGTVVSVLKLVPIKKSPISAGLSYTQDGNTGMGWPEFFLFCLSRRIFRVSSRGCWEKRGRERRGKRSSEIKKILNFKQKLTVNW